METSFTNAIEMLYHSPVIFPNTVTIFPVIKITVLAVLRVIVTASLTLSVYSKSRTQLFMTSPPKWRKRRNQINNSASQDFYSDLERRPFRNRIAPTFIRHQGTAGTRVCISGKSLAVNQIQLLELNKNCFVRQLLELPAITRNLDVSISPRKKGPFMPSQFNPQSPVFGINRKPCKLSCISDPPEVPDGRKLTLTCIVDKSIKLTPKTSLRHTTSADLTCLLHDRQSRLQTEKPTEQLVSSSPQKWTVSSNSEASGIHSINTSRSGKSLLLTLDQLPSRLERFSSPIYVLRNRKNKQSRNTASSRLTVVHNSPTTRKIGNKSSETSSRPKLLKENHRPFETRIGSKPDARPSVCTESTGLETSSLKSNTSPSKLQPSKIPKTTSCPASIRQGKSKTTKTSSLHFRRFKKSKGRRNPLNNNVLGSVPSVPNKPLQPPNKSSDTLGVKLTAAGQHGFLRNASTGSDTPEGSFTIMNIQPSESVIPKESRSTRAIGTSITDGHLLKRNPLLRHPNRRSVHVQVDSSDKIPFDAKTLFQKLLPRTNALNSKHKERSSTQSTCGGNVDVYKVQSAQSNSQSPSSRNTSEKLTYVDVHYHSEKVKAVVKVSTLRSNSSNATSFLSSLDGEGPPQVLQPSSSSQFSNTTASKPPTPSTVERPIYRVTVTKKPSMSIPKEK